MMGPLQTLAGQMRMLETIEYPDHRQRLAWRIVREAFKLAPLNGPTWALLRARFDQDLRYEPPPPSSRPRIITGRWIDVEREAFNALATEVVGVPATWGADFDADSQSQIRAVAVWLESLDDSGDTRGTKSRPDKKRINSEDVKTLREIKRAIPDCGSFKEACMQVVSADSEYDRLRKLKTRKPEHWREIMGDI